MYVWFVEAKDAQTNAIISRELSGDTCREGVKCADGIKRNLWECNYHFVSRLKRNRKQLRLEFAVFNQDGPNSEIREWKF